MIFRSGSRPLPRQMAHGFNCARLAQSKRGVVTGGSLAVARRTVVLSSGGQRRLPEGIDLLAAVGAKGNAAAPVFRTLIEA